MGTSKGAGVQWLLNALGIAASHVLAVGDGEIGKKIQTAYALGKVEAELVAVEISATQAVLSAHLSNEPMSTPEPAMALGLLTAALGIIFPRREN